MNDPKPVTDFEIIARCLEIQAEALIRMADIIRNGSDEGVDVAFKGATKKPHNFLKSLGQTDVVYRPLSSRSKTMIRSDVSEYLYDQDIPETDSLPYRLAICFAMMHEGQFNNRRFMTWVNQHEILREDSTSGHTLRSIAGDLRKKGIFEPLGNGQFKYKPASPK